MDWIVFRNWNFVFAANSGFKLFIPGCLYDIIYMRILWMENLVGWSQLSGAIYWKLFRPLLLLPLQEVAEWRQGGERFSKALLIRRWGGRGIVNFNLLLPKRNASPLPPALLLLLPLLSPPSGVRKGSHVFPIGRRAGLLLFQQSVKGEFEDKFLPEFIFGGPLNSCLWFADRLNQCRGKPGKIPRRGFIC